ncbi:MAG: DUF512 domain-containing protein [Cellulosilyticaceae bacterium]
MENNRRLKPHKITGVEPGSIAEELEIEAGDILLSINNEPIQDVFDYRYLLSDEEIEVCIRKADGEEWAIDIEKEFSEDLGLEFETELMDELISCRNKCQFCFIDQLPPNMRKTVYLKDDDWRMSFLNGNYITLTNMSDYDIERLIKYRLSPINISIHATDPDVRIALLKNRFAGRILEQIKTLVDAGIEINGQIVLCKGINDGKILDQTIRDLSAFIPHILSLTIVPVGISRFRENLPVLEPFDQASAQEVVEVVEKWQQYYLEKMGRRFVFAADEFYVTGEVALPEYDSYEGFYVLDNGVGMLTKFKIELQNALNNLASNKEVFEATIATGCITEDFMRDCVESLQEKRPNYKINVVPIVNKFFGEQVTVTGLLTGQDIIDTLKTVPNKGRILLLAENMLKCGENILLDDYTVPQIEQALGMEVVIVPNDGAQWLEIIIQTKEKCNE